MLLLRGPERSVKAFSVGVAEACAAALKAEPNSAGIATRYIYPIMPYFRSVFCITIELHWIPCTND